MIVGLEGEIIHKTPTSLWVKCYGVVYEVFVPLHLLSSAGRVELWITQIVREDGLFLYGFLQHDDKVFFDRLIKINGVGPKIALAILSTYMPQEFMQLIQTQNIKALQKVPGLGAKSVQRILLELTGFCLDTQHSEQSYLIEARMALESLGFKPDRIQKALAEIEANDVQEAIKAALRKLT